MAFAVLVSAQSTSGLSCATVRADECACLVVTGRSSRRGISFLWPFEREGRSMVDSTSLVGVVFRLLGSPRCFALYNTICF